MTTRPEPAPLPADGHVLPDPALAWRLDAPPLTVAGLLSLSVLQRGRPEVLAGRDLDRRIVRWVHTSEIYEISPLLKGGEVLLTTGLGLIGAGPAALADYVTALAQRSVAALLLELGRTFTRAPEALVAAADESGLPLITLHGIVPFVEITESVHTLLISREIAELRLNQHLQAAATDAVLSGSGLVALLEQLAVFADCPVRVFADDGHLVAASDADAIGPTGRPALTDVAHDAPRATIELHSHPWGTIVVCGPPTATRTIIAARGATAVALELRRGGGPERGSTRDRARAQLLRDIFGRQYSAVDEIAARAAALGMTIRPGTQLCGVCLAIDGAADGRAAAAPATAIARAAERVCGPCLVTELDGSYLIGACVDPTDLRQLTVEVADAVDAALTAGRAMAVASGPAVADFGALARSLRIAREASVLARRLHSGRRTLTYTDVGVQRLLSRFATDPELAAFVDEQLGPLLDYDAARGRELVRTLDTLLAHGLSKAATARDLHIRRQTLYQRLETITRLLGGLDLTSRERRTSLDLALVGWRLRTTGLQSERPAGGAH